MEATTASPGLLRRGAAQLHLALCVLVVVGVFVQVYLIGGYLFGAGTGALDAHESVGFIVHGFEALVLVTALVAWLPRTDLWLSLLLVVAGTAQVGLADADRWTGALHPLGALFVLVLGTVLVHRALARRRALTARPREVV